MRRAARIVEKMHARILEVIEPGLRKNELVAEIYDAALRGAEDEDGRSAATMRRSCRSRRPARTRRRRI